MKPPTPFCEAVIGVIKNTRGQTIAASRLRKELMCQGWGKHPAAVAMNITKLACKGEYITGYVDNTDSRVFMLTAEGRDV